MKVGPIENVYYFINLSKMSMAHDHVIRGGHQVLQPQMFFLTTTDLSFNKKQTKKSDFLL